MTNYSTFAQLYQNLFDKSLYKQWLDFVLEKSTPGKLLDIGGGNGELAVLLAKKKYQVSILDLSIEMLMLAKEKIEKDKLDIQLINDDMSEFDLNEKFTTIVSFADSINYLNDEKLVLKTFVNVFNHLDDDGVFLFDLITPYMANVTYKDYMFNDDSDQENIFMWTSYPGDAQNSVDHDLKFFVYDKKIDGFKIQREIHHEQTYPILQIEKLLKKSGFTKIVTTSNFGRELVSSDAERVFLR